MLDHSSTPGRTPDYLIREAPAPGIVAVYPNDPLTTEAFVTVLQGLAVVGRQRGSGSSLSFSLVSAMARYPPPS